MMQMIKLHTTEIGSEDWRCSTDGWRNTCFHLCLQINCRDSEDIRTLTMNPKACDGAAGCNVLIVRRSDVAGFNCNCLKSYTKCGIISSCFRKRNLKPSYNQQQCDNGDEWLRQISLLHVSPCRIIICTDKKVWLRCICWCQ